MVSAEQDFTDDFSSWTKTMNSYYRDSYPEEIKKAKEIGERIKKAAELDDSKTDVDEARKKLESIESELEKLKELENKDWTGHPLRKDNVTELRKYCENLRDTYKSAVDDAASGKKKEKPKKFKTVIDVTCKTLKNFASKMERYRKEHSDSKGRFLGLNELEQSQARENLNKVFERSNLYAFANIQFLDNVLTDHYKNLHETGRGDGSTNKRGRRLMSEGVFGTPPGTKNEDMEKYGFFGDVDESWGDLSGRIHYGRGGTGPRVLYEFRKDTMKDRTTYSVDDSLGWHGSMCGMLDDDSTLEGVSYGYRSSSCAKELASGNIKTVTDLRRQAGGSYVEAQYHGTITAKDIASLRFEDEVDARYAVTGMSDAARKLVKENGIKILLGNGRSWKEVDLEDLI